MTTDLALRALAAFVADCRPDWQAPGILTALRAEAEAHPLQLAQRMLRRASDPRNTSPRLQPFDEAVTIGCRSHPGAPTRTNGDCGVCFSERYADEAAVMRDRGGRPIPAEARAEMQRAITKRSTAQPRERKALPDSEAREAARAHLENLREKATG